VGAHEIHGDVLTEWYALRAGGVNLGHPLTDMIYLVSPAGYSQFQNGFILTRPGLGAHGIYGVYLTVWQSYLNAGDSLGYPVTEVLPDGRGGWFQHFQNGGIWIDRFGRVTSGHYTL
jgi:uncharacterized protein with LGFP repeats